VKTLARLELERIELNRKINELRIQADIVQHAIRQTEASLEQVKLRIKQKEEEL
jgi:hypothetical protein